MIKYFIPLLLSISACSHGGPKVTACIVDAELRGFDCVKYPNKELFIPFVMGNDLICEAPADLEDQLKACKYKKPIPNVPLCSYSLSDGLFHCQEGSSAVFFMTPELADMYFCTSPQDRKRLIDRCSHMKEPSLWEYIFGIKE